MNTRHEPRRDSRSQASGRLFGAFRAGGLAPRPVGQRRVLKALNLSRSEDRSGPWLWALDVERRNARRLSTGLGQYTSISASRDGRRAVAAVANPTFKRFVKATKCVTVAERTPTKEQFPTAPPENLVAGSVVFHPPDRSFLCTDQYCKRYMPGGRGKREPDTRTDHLGFRCVKAATTR